MNNNCADTTSYAHAVSRLSAFLTAYLSHPKAKPYWIKYKIYYCIGNTSMLAAFLCQKRTCHRCSMCGRFRRRYFTGFLAAFGKLPTLTMSIVILQCALYTFFFSHINIHSESLRRQGAHISSTVELMYSSKM